ncbi:ArpU family phage packaging/lysis transcriptional regulator [Bacillus safensis]|uniref:ArpU family phage packaging/lysis transcriptional regulator n=1 Tax=Bacillus safensis TaxID=561879 RepID=UPI00355BE941
MLVEPPVINKKETRKRVVNILDNYRLYLLQVPDEMLPKITAVFSIMPPAATNAFHSSTESTAVKRIDREQKRNAYLERVQRAVNRLPYNERQIIIKRYMQQEPVFDYQVYNEIGMSERSYSRLKGKTILDLAYALNEVVFKAPV